MTSSFHENEGFIGVNQDVIVFPFTKKNLLDFGIFFLLWSTKTSIFVETRCHELSKTSILSKKYWKYKKFYLREWFFFEKFCRTKWVFVFFSSNFQKSKKYWRIQNLFSKKIFFGKNIFQFFFVNRTFRIFNIFSIGLKFWKAYHL